MVFYNIKVRNKKTISYRINGRIKTFKKGKTYSFRRNLTPKEVLMARKNNKTMKVLSIKLARKKKK